MLTLYLVVYATVQMYDITTNRQSILLKRNGKLALFVRSEEICFLYLIRLRRGLRAMGSTSTCIRRGWRLRLSVAASVSVVVVGKVP